MYQRIILLILLPFFGFSQAPQKINFQSILRNSSGEVIGNKSVSLKISILSGSINSSSVYSETHAKTTDASGLISLQIGNGTVLSGVFANIAWGGASHFIKLEADFSGGSNYVVLGTQELMSVPYALYASKTDTSSLNLVNRFNSKVNVYDTSNMLSNYRTGLNSKVNISDTSLMLNPYLRKADSLIADLQLQIKQLQSLSNVIDIDGNSYKTVKIGSQLWMSENLKTSRFRNGDSIPYVVGNADWEVLTTGAWSYYNNDAANNAIYGKLYNWYTTQGDTLCPIGWHVPGVAEWSTLISFLGYNYGKLRATGTVYWLPPNSGATNESGFSAFPGGVRGNDGSFYQNRSSAYFWLATEIDNNSGWFNKLTYAGINAESETLKSLGQSVRCLNDQIPTLTTNSIRQVSTTGANIGGKITGTGGSKVTTRGVVWNTSGMPIISDNKTTDGSGTGSYVSNLTTLSPSTTYYVRAYATNSTGIAYGNQKTFTTTATSQTLTDIDGNTYNTVQIGSQLWMSENLKTSHYRNGGSIPNVIGNNDWEVLTTGAWSYYDNDAANNAIYGKLYNWYTTLGDTLCPTGWHVPNDTEWTTLTTYLGGESVAGGKMKSIYTDYWTDPNTEATNESGFSALPGGLREYGGFQNISYIALFRSASDNTQFGNIYSNGLGLSSGINSVYRGWPYDKISGVSVRCLRN